MDKSRSKRPPDVNEALSSMLWTPYDRTANISSSSDSLTDDERQRGQRKLNRYSNPLPNSLNWWNSHIPSAQPMALRYSFPYYGNYFPSHPTNDSVASATTTKRTVSTTVDVGNHGQTINTSTFSTTMVHSFTDDFYQYQNQPPHNISNCQSTHKNHKSQPSLLFDSLLNASPSSSERINSHLVSPSNISAATHDDKLFNHQRNNVRNAQASRWRNGKAGNVGDLNSYVHEDSNKKHERTCTNTTPVAEGKSRKVTQPPNVNVTQSYSTLSRKCNERRGNKQNEHERNKTWRESKTSASDGMVAAKQISHNRDSSENAAEYLGLEFYCENRHDVGEKYYRLLHSHSGVNSARMDPPQLDVAGSPQMPISPSTFANFSGAATSSANLPSTSSGPSSYPNDLEYQLKRKDVEAMISSEIDNPARCKVDVNFNRYRVNAADYNQVTVLMSNEIDHKMSDENANSNVKSFQSADKSSIEATSGPLVNADNLIVTSAIENTSTVAVENGTPEKAKYPNEVLTLREKRRRDRRDRRLARTRAINGASLSCTNEILPDILNSHVPPSYADIPPQQIVPSIVSTVPVEDNRYTFSLPLVRRSTSDRSGKDCCGQWFNGPPLRFLVVLVALGGVACTLGGATLGSIALAGSPTSHLTAGLLMTGVGIVLVTISGVAWRMTTSDAHQCSGRCGRRQCARGNSSFGLLYPEFQHRPPPPSYIQSMQEHRLREMMLNRERQASNARASPPPSYLNSNTGTLLRPSILFQRQSHITNNVQVEIPIDNSSMSNDSMNANSSAASDCSGYQSPTSSQTITTIASINRWNDNEFTLMSASRETAADISTLITQNGRVENEGVDKARRDGSKAPQFGDAMNQTSHENFNCNSSRSSGTCTSDTYNDRSISCNKNSVSIMDHSTAVNNCKNVNISNTKELNKALIPLTHLPPPSRDALTRNGITFLNGVRCEMGVR